MVDLRSSFWVVALFVALALPGASLSAAITPIGDVTPSTIGQVPSQEVIIGNFDVGGLTISAGSALTTQTGLLGLSEFGVGAATITGSGSEWTNTGQLDVGRVGMGFLDIEAGGKLSSTRTHVGEWDVSTGTITVSGVGSEFVGDWLRVGNRGSGTLLIEAGGEVANNWDAILGFFTQIRSEWRT
jgi:fibronectin-binding autotransporter adhesin